MMGRKTTILDIIRNNDIKIIYGLLLILMFLPMLLPFGIPIKVSPTTEALYRFVESLKPGSVVMVNAGITPSAYPEISPGLKAFVEHAFRKDLKLVVWCESADAPVMWEKLMSTIKLPPGKKYGVDWVFLGFIPGGETAIAALASDIWAASPMDYYKNPLKDLPLMERVRNAKDLAAYFDASMAYDSPGFVVRQFVTPYNVPFLACYSTGMTPASMPYYPKQLIGVLYGIRGGAEYEILINKPWRGISYTDTLSAVNLFIVLIIVIANVNILFRRRK
jgi:hypothetical protein